MLERKAKGWQKAAAAVISFIVFVLIWHLVTLSPTISQLMAN